MCKHKATEQSPLKNAKPNDRTGGLWPWLYYRKNKKTKATSSLGKVIKELISKTPQGSACSICNNVYKACGYSAKYGVKGGMKKYKSVMAGPQGAEIHRVFLSCVNDWISQHNEDGSTVRLKSKNQLMQTFKKLDVEKNKKTGFKGRKKVFVEEADWDVKQHGVFDKEKVTEEFIHGSMRKGCFVFVGPQGVWEVIDEEDTTIKNTTVEEQGEGSLVEKAIETKESMMYENLASINKARDAVAQEAPAFDIHDLLKLANFDSTADADAAAKGDAAGEDDAAMSIHSDGSEATDAEGDDSDDDQNRMASYFGGPAAKASKGGAGSAHPPPQAKAKAKASGKPATSVEPQNKVHKHLLKRKGHGVGLNRPVGGGVSPGVGCGRSGAQTSAAASSSGGAGTMVTLDGRGQRLQESVKLLLEEEQKKLDDLKFDEEQRGMILLGDAQTEFNKAVVVKARGLMASRNAIKAMMTRVENSSNKKAFADDIETMTAFLARLDDLYKFTEVILKPVIDLDAAINAAKVTFESFIASMGHPSTLFIL